MGKAGGALPDQPRVVAPRRTAHPPGALNRRRQFWHYLTKVFDLPRAARGGRTDRPEADIPSPPTLWESHPRQVRAWEVKDLSFTEPALGPVRVVLTQEQWEQATWVAGQTVRQPQESHGRWIVTREFDRYDGRVIWQIGHRRWGNEENIAAADCVMVVPAGHAELAAWRQ